MNLIILTPNREVRHMKTLLGGDSNFCVVFVKVKVDYVCSCSFRYRGKRRKSSTIDNFVKDVEIISRELERAIDNL